MDGHEVDGTPFDTNTERNICKIIETVCESVPASIIAMVALLLIGKWAWAPIVSIGISWITTAFKATSLTFSMDKDRMKRKRDPWYA
jgi:predicted anti-sigma-YlaC factor YlaD